MSVPVSEAGWRTVKFGDVVRLCKEKVDRDNNPFERYVEGGHMDSENIHIRRWGEFGEDYVGPAFHRIFRKGQILYGSRRTYLKKVAVAEFDGITANTTFVLETKDQSIFMQELLPFLMLTDKFTQHSIQESKGSTNPYINWPDIAKFEFPLPPIEEQKRIAEILWAADEAVERWSQSIKDLRLLIGNLGVAYFKNANLDHDKFSEHVAESAYGPRFSNSLYSESGAVGQIRTTDLSDDGTVNYSTVPMAHLDTGEYQQHILKSGDLLISRSGTIGIACVFEEQSVPMLPGAFLIRFRLKETLHPEFVREYFNSPIGRKHTSRLAQGGVQSNLRGSALLNEWVPILSVLDQEKTVDIFFHLREELTILYEHKAKAKQVLRVLCNQALMGEERSTHV